MKTAISIPDPIFEAAEQLVQQLGISHSQLYSTAIAAYLDKQRQVHVIEKLNRLYATEDSTLDTVGQELQALSLAQEDW